MLFIAIVVVVLFTILYVRAVASRPNRYPPGPMLLPYVGSIYAVPAQGVHHRIEDWRKKYGNIIGHKYGSAYEVYITGIDESLAAMKHPNFQGRRTFHHRNKGQKRGLFFNDGPAWSILKRFTLNYFSEYQKDKIELLVRDEMKYLFSNVITDSEILVDYKFFSITMPILMKIIGRVDRENHQSFFDKLLPHLYRSMHDTRPTGIEIHFPSLQRYMNKNDNNPRFAHEFFANCIREHRSTLNPDNVRDYIDAFLIEQRKNSDVFSDEELVSDCYDLVRTGSTSTADATMLVMLYVLLYPDVQRKMLLEIDERIGRDKPPTVEDKKRLPYCEAVIAEAFRINPPVRLTAPHRVTDDTEFYGHLIPKDTNVKISLWTLFRDPKLWDNADEFKPERFVNNGEFIKYPHHLPFGLGKRSCLMESMAKNTVFLFLVTFFQKFSIRLPVGCPPPTTCLVEGSTAGPQPFKMIISQR